MKKIVLVSSLISATLFADGLTVIESKSFSKTVKSDIVSTHLLVELKSASLNNLKKDIDTLLKITKKYKECVNDEYAISSNQFYKQINNKTSKEMDYKANLGFNCSFKNIKELSKLVNSIKNNKLKIGKIDNDISDKVKLQTLKELENRAYSYPNNRVKELSKKLGMNCHLVNSNVYILNGSSYRFKKAIKSMNNIPLADKVAQTLSVEGRYSYKCK